MGNTRYATTFGMYAAHLPAGKHTIAVQYKTGGRENDNKFDALTDWQTRALNVIALPEAQVNIINPRWGFKLNSADLWSDWQGFEQEFSFDEDTPVLAFYSISCYGKNTFLGSKMFIDGHEKKATRSVNGNTEYGSNIGFFADTMLAGAHTWTVKYRTQSRNNFFMEDSTGNDWMNRVMSVVQLPGSSIHKVYSDEEYTTAATQTWTTWKGLEKELKLDSDRYVIAFYSVATKAHSRDVQVSTVRGRMDINDNEQTQTRSRCGNVKYCQLLGMWMGMLSVGTHSFKVKYATASALTMEAGGEDWGNRALNIIVLSHLSSAVSLLQEAAEVHHEHSGGEASFLDVGSRLQRVQQIEAQIRDGTVPQELMEKLAKINVDDAVKQPRMR